MQLSNIKTRLFKWALLFFCCCSMQACVKAGNIIRSAVHYSRASEDVVGAAIKFGSDSTITNVDNIHVMTIGERVGKFFIVLQILH
jgi:hypothetical protein